MGAAEGGAANCESPAAGPPIRWRRQRVRARRAGGSTLHGLWIVTRTWSSSPTPMPLVTTRRGGAGDRQLAAGEAGRAQPQDVRLARRDVDRQLVQAVEHARALRGDDGAPLCDLLVASRAAPPARRPVRARRRRAAGASCAEQLLGPGPAERVAAAQAGEPRRPSRRCGRRAGAGTRRAAPATRRACSAVTKSTSASSSSTETCSGSASSSSRSSATRT